MTGTSLPFEPLVFEGDTYTFTNCTKLVLFSGDQEALLPFNQCIGSAERCSLSETPCGGLKHVRFPDMFPGSLSLEVGIDCYLVSANGYIGKVLSAGQLSESQEIITAGSEGIAYCLANGDEYLMANGDSYLVTPPNTIVCKFKLCNFSNSSQLCRIVVRCPDSVDSIQMYNRDTASYDDTIFAQITQDTGTVNAYDCYRVMSASSSENLQIMIKYNDLSWTYKFESSEHKALGLWNLNTFLAFYDPSTKDVNYLLFTKVPESLTCTVNALGDVTRLVIPKSDSTVFWGKIKYGPINQMVGEVPKCFVSSETGSLAGFLKRYYAITNTQNIELKTYVVTTITDDRILPSTRLSSNLVSNSISIRACPGEYHPCSFVLRSNKDVTLTIEASDLICGSNTISKNNIDIKYVKCWYQSGFDNKSTRKLGRYLTPELLVNDDSLIITNCDEWETWDLSNPYAKEYLKLTTGEYIDISVASPTTPGQYKPSLTERPVSDAATLQPVFLPKNFNKQIWLTVKLPDDIPAGIYQSTISIKSGNTVLRTITLSVEALPITLLPPTVEYSIYYRGKIYGDGSISSEYKTEEQFLAEQIDMWKHGVTNPTLMTHTTEMLPTALALRAQSGMSNNVLYYNGTINIDDSITDIETWRDVCSSNGVSQLYIYGHDEADMDTTELRAKMTAIHDAGVKIFCAQNATYALAVKDVLDLAIGSNTFTPEQVQEFKDASGNKIYSYGNPQLVPECPETYRRNYGLYLYQIGYDGAMPYAYQHSWQDIWNDWDDEYHRDHGTTYPTIDGVIDTVQWEGFREGVTDMKYLATLQAAITANPGTTATEADNWLASLKTTDLSTVNLDEIRSKMTDYILTLQGD